MISIRNMIPRFSEAGRLIGALHNKDISPETPKRVRETLQRIDNLCRENIQQEGLFGIKTCVNVFQLWGAFNLKGIFRKQRLIQNLAKTQLNRQLVDYRSLMRLQHMETFHRNVENARALVGRVERVCISPEDPIYQIILDTPGRFREALGHVRPLSEHRMNLARERFYDEVNGIIKCSDNISKVITGGEDAWNLRWFVNHAMFVPYYRAELDRVGEGMHIFDEAVENQLEELDASLIEIDNVFMKKFFQELETLSLTPSREVVRAKLFAEIKFLELSGKYEEALERFESLTDMGGFFKPHFARNVLERKLSIQRKRISVPKPLRIAKFPIGEKRFDQIKEGLDRFIRPVAQYLMLSLKPAVVDPQKTSKRGWRCMDLDTGQFSATITFSYETNLSLNNLFNSLKKIHQLRVGIYSHAENNTASLVLDLDEEEFTNELIDHMIESVTTFEQLPEAL